jgi:hypothetical protein
MSRQEIKARHLVLVYKQIVGCRGALVAQRWLSFLRPHLIEAGRAPSVIHSRHFLTIVKIWVHQDCFLGSDSLVVSDDGGLGTFLGLRSIVGISDIDLSALLLVGLVVKLVVTALIVWQVDSWLWSQVFYSFTLLLIWHTRKVLRVRIELNWLLDVLGKVRGANPWIWILHVGLNIG